MLEERSLIGSTRLPGVRRLERMLFDAALPRLAGLMQVVDQIVWTFRLLSELQRPAYVSRPRLPPAAPVATGD